MRSVLFASLLWLGVTHAQEGILVERLPTKLDAMSVLNSAKDALDSREWTVISTSAESVSATIDRGKYEARIEISIKAGQLYYRITDKAGAELSPDAKAATTRWAGVLRGDISTELRILSRTLEAVARMRQ